MIWFSVEQKFAIVFANQFSPFHLYICDNSFLGRPGLLSLLQQSEGNTLAATEFIRLLEVPGSITAKQSTGTRENTQILGSNSRV